jgi:NADH dehydrogenase FAD-containing subunit
VRIAYPDLPDPVEVSYDQLVLALGAVTNFFYPPGLAEHAMTMKTLGDAILVRNRVIDALELATTRRTRPLSEDDAGRWWWRAAVLPASKPSKSP